MNILLPKKHVFFNAAPDNNWMLAPSLTQFWNLLFTALGIEQIV
jgi:hypothetical protein